MKIKEIDGFKEHFMNNLIETVNKNHNVNCGDKFTISFDGDAYNLIFSEGKWFIAFLEE